MIVTKEEIQAQIDLIDDIKSMVDDNYLFDLNQRQNSLLKQLKDAVLIDTLIKDSVIVAVELEKSFYVPSTHLNG